MAQFRSLFVLIIFQVLTSSFVHTRSESLSAFKSQELAQFVLKTFNDRPDKSFYSYNSAEVIQAHRQNGSETEYYLKLKFSVSCHPDTVTEAECFPKDLICEVTMTEDPIDGWKSVYENDTKCSLPTHEEEVPENKEQMPDSTIEKNEEEENKEAVLKSMPPFLLKHNIDHMMAVSEEPTATPVVDERMIVDEEPMVEEVILSEAAEPEAVEELIVQKKEHCTGCVTDISTDLPELQEFTDEALTMIDENSNGIYKHNLIKITKAQKQVVSGIKYILTLEVAETYCLKSSNQDRETCEPSLSSARACVVEFIVKPWRFSRNIISNNCTQDSNDQNNNISNLENEIVPHFTNTIESQFGNDLNAPVTSDMKPFFPSKSDADRQGIFDYLDEMDHTDTYVAPGVDADNGNIPAVPFTESENDDMDFEDIDIQESDDAKDKNVDLKAKEKRTEKDTATDDHFKKSSEEGESSESKESREQRIKDNSSESKDDLDESEERITSLSTDDGFVRGVYRRRREIRGGNHPIGWKNIAETEKKLVHDLAELAVRTLDEIDADDSKRVVLDILDAKKQFLDGVMYYLKLRVGSTSCEENKATTNGCLQDQIAIPKLCTVQLHRSFAVDSPNDIKVVKSECTNEPRGRHRRSGRKLVGGYEAANISDPYIQEVASFALADLDKNSNSLFQQTIVRVVEAHQQVVSGLNVLLTLEIGDSNCRKGENHTGPCLCQNTEGCPVTQVCHVQIWDQPWLKKRVVTNSSCETRETRAKRGLEGGVNEISVNDPEVQNMVKFALAHLEGISNSANAQKIVKVIHATHQVVAGYKYGLTLELGETTCQKGKDVDASTCNLKEGSVNQICTVEIWEQAWLNKTEVVSVSCGAKDVRTKRQLIGGATAISVNDPEVRDAAKFALTHLEGISNSANAQKIVQVIRATRQVVSGTKYGLTMELGETTCRKGQGVDASTCNLKNGSTNQICTVDVWDQPWLKKRMVTRVSCENKQARSRRSASNHLLGAPSEVSVDEPEIKEVAKFALAHLDGISNALYAQKIVKVVHATQQVVAGKKYQLTMELGYTACRKGQEVDTDTCELKEDSNNQICHVTVHTRPWVNETRVLNASCSPSVSVTKRSSFGGGTHDIHIGLFRDFVAKHKKTYANEAEYKRRFRIFRANMKKVLLLRQTEQGTAKYGATQFADLTSKEFKKYHLGLRQDLKAADQPMLPIAEIPSITLPPEFDWRHYNAVTPVKNQGMCGSCWAFSVTGNVEGQWALRRGQLLSLSEQELVDCDKLDDGCKGGLPENAYKAITTLGGLETEQDYPYEGDDETCHFNKTEVKVTVVGGVNVTSNETKMAQWLVKNGPISIGINANAMQFYMGGVSHPWKMLCNANDLDHGVLIVGYGVHNYPLFKKSLPFWIIKNSWGESWGEQGYYRVYRGDGTCGVNQMATSAIIG